MSYVLQFTSWVLVDYFCGYFDQGSGDSTSSGVSLIYFLKLYQTKDKNYSED